MAALIERLAQDLRGVDVKSFVTKLESSRDDPAEMAAALGTTHPDYGVLAARLKLDYIYANSKPTFLASMESFMEQLDPQFLFEKVRNFIAAHGETLIREENDRLFDYAALQTLIDMFLLKNEKGIERPQHMFLRVALHLHGSNSQEVFETYRLLSEQFYIHATPTLINAGTRTPQLSSCFIMTTPEMENFFDFVKECYTVLSQYGGIGCNFHRIPARHVVACAKILNDTLKLVEPSTIRPPSCAIYMEPWHAGIYDFLQLKKNVGPEEARARDVFYALWVPDLFMKRVEQDGLWSLFCPDDCDFLEADWGEDFERRYENYEEQKRYRRQVKARSLLQDIAATQIETGGPYIVFKDAVNRVSPYEFTIQGSNLCAEIMESSEDNTAVCTLASISLPRCISNSSFNFDILRHVTKMAVRNLNRVIDTSSYPLEDARRHSMEYRPIGLGVQGLADVFQLLRMDFESRDARLLNEAIFKTMQEAAREESQGKNILTMAVMPTVTTSLLLGNNESIEPYTSNIYAKYSKSGSFTMINPHLVKDLMELNMWSADIHEYLDRHQGSVQELPHFPYKSIYKTVWEMSQKSLIDMAADRGKYIDQSQSFNLFLSSPTVAQVISMIYYGYKAGLKTGLYYLRTQPAARPVQFSVKPAICDVCS